MAWIKIEHTMPDKPEVDRMADILGIDQDAVTGKVIRFWIWADQQLRDCNAFTVTPTLLDRLTNCPGFTAALIKVGWLKRRNNRFEIPHFDRHNSQTAKNRALTSDRVKRSRNDSVTRAPLQKRYQSKSKSKKLKKPPLIPPCEQNPRKPKRPFDPHTIPIPPLLDKSPEFITAWALWIVDRRDRGKPLTENAAKQHLAQLAKLENVTDAIELINHAINRGWTGIRADWLANARSQSGTGPNQAQANAPRNESAADRRRAAELRRDYAEPDTPVPSGLDF